MSHPAVDEARPSVPQGCIRVRWVLCPGLGARESIEVDDEARIRRSVIEVPGIGVFRVSLISRTVQGIEARCWRVKGPAAVSVVR